MNSDDLETRVKNINDRTTRMEQILPTLATKEDLKAHPTRDEMTTAIRAEGQLTRAHFDAVAEDLKEGIKVIAEGHKALGTKIDNLERR